MENKKPVMGAIERQVSLDFKDFGMRLEDALLASVVKSKESEKRQEEIDASIYRSKKHEEEIHDLKMEIERLYLIYGKMFPNPSEPEET